MKDSYGTYDGSKPEPPYKVEEEITAETNLEVARTLLARTANQLRYPHGFIAIDRELLAEIDDFLSK